MAKYTTEVRTICESKAGYEESKGANNVDTVINLAWDKIFTTNCTFFDNEYKPVLCKKILKHYYRREIGAETVGLWTLWMNTKLEEIMPYYNQLYNSELIEFDPMTNMNLTKTGNTAGTENTAESNTLSRETTAEDGGRRTESGSSNATSEASSDATTLNSDTTNHTDAYSDTPQGSISNVNNNAYLTNYRKIFDEVDTSRHDQSSYEDESSETTSKTINYGKTNELNTDESRQKAGTLNSTEQYIESVIGNNGSWNFSKLLQDFRDTFLNIDMMVINEFKDLFMGLW